MRKVAFYTASIGFSLMLAACGGGKKADEAAVADQTAGAPETAAPAPASPSADSTDTVDGTRFSDLSGHAANGEKVFLQCKVCHSLEEGKNMIGPSLHGIVGRKASALANYQYSPANHNSGITWTPEKLFQFLEKPQRVVPGTKMAFAGLPKAQDRADLIAYLQTASK